MKKFLLLLLSISLFSCSGDDDDNRVRYPDQLNPPAWIHGTWGRDEGNGVTTALYRFTQYDGYSIISDTERSLIPYNEGDERRYELEEIINDTEYDFTIYTVTTNQSWQVEAHYLFKKRPDTKIEAPVFETPHLEETLIKLD